MTHEQLVARAVLWLRNKKRCGVVLAERKCLSVSEVPDAIGWRGSWSIVVECKATRRDFRHDRKKPHRRNGRGMGQARYFMTPTGLVRPEELPEGWGLVEVRGCRFDVVREATSTPGVNKAELELLYAFARRTQLGFEPTFNCLKPKPRRPALALLPKRCG